jgi:hypothetical protein
MRARSGFLALSPSSQPGKSLLFALHPFAAFALVMSAAAPRDSDALATGPVADDRLPVTKLFLLLVEAH